MRRARQCAVREQGGLVPNEPAGLPGFGHMAADLGTTLDGAVRLAWRRARLARSQNHGAWSFSLTHRRPSNGLDSPE
jgi:hypothetical protein